MKKVLSTDELNSSIFISLIDLLCDKKLLLTVIFCKSVTSQMNKVQSE
jgi:hypothetical protein